MFLDDVDYLAFKHIHWVHFIQCTFFISTYAPESYRIANREPSRHTQGAWETARGAAVGSDQNRQGGRWGTFGVPRSPPELLRERQAPEHFLPGLQLLIKYFTLIDALRSGVFATVAALYLVYLCYTISLLPGYPQSSQCLAGLDR